MNDKLLTVIVVAICSIAGWCIILAAATGLGWVIEHVLRAIGA